MQLKKQSYDVATSPWDCFRGVEIADVVALALLGERKATKILNSKLAVKASRRHKPRLNERTVEILVTIGKPNYAERELIKKAKREKQSFPIRALKSWVKR